MPGTIILNKALIDRVLYWIALGFGSGNAPFAPGSFGTLVGIPFVWLLVLVSPLVSAIIIIVLFLLGVVICDAAATQMGEHDHPSIVWDEVVGFLITMWAVPFGLWQVVLGYGLFRFFDIVKPWPIKVLDQRVGGGFGIMIDDVLAGVMAGILLYFINNYFLL